MAATFTQLVLASNNPGKVKEIESMASELHWQLTSQSDFNTPEAIENGLSFIENAIIKARNAAKYSGLPALADDSGLEVCTLNGAPGIYSARFSGDQASDKSNNELLLDKLSGIPQQERSANFRCCFALVRHELDPCPVIAEGIWRGSIALEEKGSEGFGYDPLFIIDDLGLHSAELTAEEKNKISHRALAFSALVDRLQSINA